MKRFLKLSAWWARWWHTLFAIVGTVMAFVGAYWGSYSGDDETPWKIWIFEIPWQFVGFGVGIVGVTMAAVLPVRETRALNARISTLESDVSRAEEEGREKVDQAKVEGREDFLLIVDFVLLPLLRNLGRLSRTKPQSRARKELEVEIRTLALNALKEVIDPSIPRLRANFYRLKYSSSDQPYLAQAGSTATPPRQRFDLSRPGTESDALLDMLATGSYVFTADCINDPPPGFDNTRPRSYETFISASASDGSEVVGMLTVDSPEAGSLTEADAVLVRLIATVVAIADAIAMGKRD
ncbi:GAF domain-containing protein [Paenarthrobacter sp. NPDC089714]|uniref:GAF domain-containing protein n=1 Tax=Paenarthrobacter sp. NPDC089714 TaxID=3364377 RepID=UPI003800C35A